MLLSTSVQVLTYNSFNLNYNSNDVCENWQLIPHKSLQAEINATFFSTCNPNLKQNKWQMNIESIIIRVLANMAAAVF